MSCFSSKNETPRDGSTAYVATAETSVRAGFIRKVYSILTLQFLITIGMSCAFAFIDPIREFVVKNQWLMIIAIVFALGSVIALFCFRTRFPVNLAIFVVFTLAYSFMVATIVAVYFEAGAGKIVLQAFVLTAVVFISITLFVFITRKDFNFLGGFLFAAFLILLTASIANFALGLVGVRSRLFSFAISVLGALVFTGFLLYDTSQVVSRCSPRPHLALTHVRAPSRAVILTTPVSDSPRCFTPVLYHR